jgi:hypothetical protein
LHQASAVALDAVADRGVIGIDNRPARQLQVGQLVGPAKGLGVPAAALEAGDLGVAFRAPRGSDVRGWLEGRRITGITLGVGRGRGKGRAVALLQRGAAGQPRGLSVRAPGQDGSERLGGLVRTAELQQVARQAQADRVGRGHDAAEVGIAGQGATEGRDGVLGVVRVVGDEPGDDGAADLPAGLLGQLGGLGEPVGARREPGHRVQGLGMGGVVLQRLAQHVQRRRELSMFSQADADEGIVLSPELLGA